MDDPAAIDALRELIKQAIDTCWDTEVLDLIYKILNSWNM